MELEISITVIFSPTPIPSALILNARKSIFFVLIHTCFYTFSSCSASVFPIIRILLCIITSLHLSRILFISLENIPGAEVNLKGNFL